MKKDPARFARRRSLCTMGQALDALVATQGGARRLHLNALWENWAHVMGDDIARLGRPLGHHKTTLLIGTDDNMAMQELVMLTWEILDRANAFMDEPYFTEVKPSLMQGRNAPTDRRVGMSPVTVPPVIIPPPANLGRLSASLDPELHYARYYKAYVKAMQGDGPEGT